MYTNLLHEDELGIDGHECPRVRQLLKPEIFVFDRGLVPDPTLRRFNVRTETTITTHGEIDESRLRMAGSRISGNPS